jgi:hypothetical protein
MSKHPGQCPNDHAVAMGAHRVTSLHDKTEQYLCADCGHRFAGPPVDPRERADGRSRLDLLRVGIDGGEDYPDAA